METNYGWRVQKSFPQIMNEFNIQNAQIVSSRTVQKKISDIWTQNKKLMVRKKKVILLKFPRTVLETYLWFGVRCNTILASETIYYNFKIKIVVILSQMVLELIPRLRYVVTYWQFLKKKKWNYDLRIQSVVFFFGLSSLNFSLYAYFQLLFSH